MNEFCQKLIRTAEASLGSAAAIIALVCTIDSIRGDQNPLINKMWITAAALGVAAGVLVIVHQHYDDRDFDALEKRNEKLANEGKTLREELAATKQVANKLFDQQAARRISESAKESIRTLLKRSPEQRFKIHAAGRANDEVKRFSEELFSVLTQCGWVGQIRDHFHAGDIAPGIAIYVDRTEDLDERISRAQTGIKAEEVWSLPPDLCEALRGMGIAVWAPDSPCAGGTKTIVIDIGEKPFIRVE